MSKIIPTIKEEFHGKKANFLGGNNWIHLYEFADSGYTFSHEPRWNDIGVAILPFRNISDEDECEFLVTNEKRPVHGEDYNMYAITGGCDDDSISIPQTALKELKEEAGYEATEDELIYLGEIKNSKMSTATMHLFAVDVTRKEKGIRSLDGSAIEQQAFTSWVDVREAVIHGDNLLAKLVSCLALYQLHLHEWDKSEIPSLNSAISHL